MSSVREFKANLGDEIMRLGLDPKFKENPAFEKIISKINSLMTYDDMNKVFVRQDGNKFLFEWTNPYEKDEIRKFKIESFSKDELIAGMVVDRKRGLDRERIVDLTRFKLNSIGGIDIITKHGTADNINRRDRRCNTLCSSTEKRYDKYGVQEIEEEKMFNPSTASMDIDSITPMTILAATDFKYDCWSQRTVVTRQYLDVATITVTHKNPDKEFRGYQMIDNQTGLQDLRYDRNLVDQKVPQLMQAEIDDMIEKESEYHSSEYVEKLTEGLGRYVEGRDRFSHEPEDVNKNTYGTSQR